MAGNNSVIDDKLHWYKDAIIYELHIKAFRDGNGDGIGDFQGLLEKLDYLQELGVTAIWVLPFYPSPLRDDGYDIADYYSINPSYGTIQQFKLFLDEAHRRNLKVITELVINHSSDQHPWFQRAKKAPKGSPERDYYVWSDDPTKYKDVRIIFQDFELSNWTWDHEAQQYYWHRFFHHQPDLNYDNPLVQDEVFKMIDYWCEMGVDGFRLDAVPYLFEREGTNGENLPETHAFLKKLRKHVDDHFPGVVFLAEANMWPEDSASYFGDGDECHMNYHFPVMPRMFMALQMEDRYPITDIFDQTPDIPETCQWAIFLRNHDELTLEMVTDEERDYMYKTYAKNPKAKINLGIRHRLAPLMGNNRKRIELLNSLLFSLPGTPVLYYGDEIGMGDNVYLGDRDGVRTPMQWSPDRNAGFSGANPQQLYLPTILDPEYHYESVNVETQRGNTSSLFWFTKRMVSLRKKYKAFGRGDLKFMNVENPKVLAFTRTYEDQTLLIVVNLSKYAQPAEIELGNYRGQVPVELFSQNRFPVIGENGTYFFTLAPHDYQWFALDKTRTEVAAEAADLPAFDLSQWDNLLDGYSRELLETNLLPAYLNKVDWFNGRGQTLFGVTITDSSKLSVDGRDSFLLLIEIDYERGLPETYQLLLTFATDVQAVKLMDNCAQSVLAALTVGGTEGVLCDGFYVTSVQQLLLNRFVESSAKTGSINPVADQNRITFEGSTILTDYARNHGDIRPKLVTSGQGYTAISYDNNFLLKMYRKIDRALNPDLEISRYLSETVKFACVPAFAGMVSLQTKGDSIALGMIQLVPESRGNGHKFMLERINNYIERILARDLSLLNTEDRLGSLSQPVSVNEISPELEDLLGIRAAEQARAIGQHIGEMHLALASGKDLTDFAPEDFSLHYQRSLFSGMQALVRENYQIQQRNLTRLPDTIKDEVETLVERKDDMLNVLKRIYDKKLDAAKIRIHGNLQLDNILLTGKDMAIQDFGGDATRSYSERRLKRSPLRDIVTMIRSFYYVAHEGFSKSLHLSDEQKRDPKRYADFWAYYMSSFFLRAYLDTVRESSLVPQQPEDLNVMIETYLLERAVIDLNYELNHRPDWVEVPLRMITSLINQ